MPAVRSFCVVVDVVVVVLLGKARSFCTRLSIPGTAGQVLLEVGYKVGSVFGEEFLCCGVLELVDGEGGLRFEFIGGGFMMQLVRRLLQFKCFGVKMRVRDSQLLGGVMSFVQ